jgi:hypothetical protein
MVELCQLKSELWELKRMTWRNKGLVPPLDILLPGKSLIYDDNDSIVNNNANYMFFWCIK